MRTLFILAFAFSGHVFAVDLKQATNDQILNELRFRLGGNPGTTMALATYSCDLNGSLKIALATDAGLGEQYSVNTGLFNNQCDKDFVDPLTRNKSKIRELTLIGVCSNSGNLTQLALTTTGKINGLAQTDYGWYADCLKQAQKINGL